MRRQRRRGDDVTVRIEETDVGKGLFVTRDFAAGEVIFEVRGREIDFAGTLAKGNRECDAFQIGPGLYLDLDPPGVFINHSCEPNTGFRDRIRLVALRALCLGEEIRYDYSTTMDEDHWTLECRCGTPDCRGTIGDFKCLPRDWKLRLIRQDVVPGFIIAAELAAGRLTAQDVDAIRQAGGDGTTWDPRASLNGDTSP